MLQTLLEHTDPEQWMYSEHSANTVVFISSLPLQLMKAAVLAESSKYIHFHRDLSAPAMSADMSQVGVTLFPSL